MCTHAPRVAAVTRWVTVPGRWVTGRRLTARCPGIRYVFLDPTPAAGRDDRDR